MDPWAKKIRKVMRERKMSVYRLARLTGINENTCYCWFKKGSSRAPHQFLRRVVENTLGIAAPKGEES